MNFQRMWFNLKRELMNKADTRDHGSYGKATELMNEVECEENSKYSTLNTKPVDSNAKTTRPGE